VETIDTLSTIHFAPLFFCSAPGKVVFSEGQAALSHGNVTDPKERVGHRETHTRRNKQGGKEGETGKARR